MMLKFYSMGFTLSNAAPLTRAFRRARACGHEAGVCGQQHAVYPEAVFAHPDVHGMKPRGAYDQGRDRPVHSGANPSPGAVASHRYAVGGGNRLSVQAHVYG